MKRGYSVRAGSNPPFRVAYATPEFAARQADDHWTIIDRATGETVGCARDFRSVPAEISNDPTQRAEATTTPEGAKGWADQAGSAQVLAGGHGLNVTPDASPDGVRAEARRREQDGNGGEPSNAPTAAHRPSILERRERWARDQDTRHENARGL